MVHSRNVIPDPITPILQPAPFDDPDWIYEIKHDGFRALAVIEHGQCRFFSRKKHKLNGELVVIDHLGRSVFASMVQRRHPARYFAFDLLSLNGEDLTHLPLLTRKEN